MTAQEAPAFLHALAVMAELFAEPFSEERGMAYFHALRDLALLEATAAIDAASSHARMFPRPGELRTFAGRSSGDIGSAYAALLRAMRSGPYRPRPSLSPILAAMVSRLGGWLRLFALTEEHLWLRFREMYEPVAIATAVRGEERAALPAPRPARVLAQLADLSPVEGLNAVRAIGAVVAQRQGEQTAEAHARIEAQRAKLREQARQLRERENA